MGTLPGKGAQILLELLEITCIIIGFQSNTGPRTYSGQQVTGISQGVGLQL